MIMPGESTAGAPGSLAAGGAGRRPARDGVRPVREPAGSAGCAPERRDAQSGEAGGARRRIRLGRRPFAPLRAQDLTPIMHIMSTQRRASAPGAPPAEAKTAPPPGQEVGPSLPFGQTWMWYFMW